MIRYKVLTENTGYKEVDHETFVKHIAFYSKYGEVRLETDLLSIEYLLMTKSGEVLIAETEY